MFLYLAVLAVLVFYYIFALRPKKYWANRGVTSTDPKPVLGDNWGLVLGKESAGDMVLRVYNSVKNVRYLGFHQISNPSLMIKDVELIKQITVKDFDYFPDHRLSRPGDHDPLWSNNLLILKGEKWKDTRPILSPSFTSAKMKAMFVLMSEVGRNFMQHFLEKDKKEIEVDLKDAFSRYTNDMIASIAFGLKVDSLKDRDNEFYRMGKEASSFGGFWINLKFTFFILFPTVAKILKPQVFTKPVSKFFRNLISDTMTVRQKNNIVRQDMLQLLMDAKNGKSSLSNGEDHENNKKDITDTEITAHSLIFFFAGFDSVSALMSFMSYELAVNPDVQRRLYEEIIEVRQEHGENVTYDALMKMTYMDMVISETLRKWPPFVITDRVCAKPYTIQPNSPDEKPLPLKKGDILVVPIYGLHRDPTFFENPDKFDPERFSEENKKIIHPYSYLPFGIGPRNCIGLRFALLETKAIYYHLLSHFEIVPSQKTVIPLVQMKKTFNMQSENGFWCNLKRRN